MNFYTIIAIGQNGIGIYTCPDRLEVDTPKFIDLKQYRYSNYKQARKALRELGLFYFGADVIDNLSANIPYFKKVKKKPYPIDHANISFGPCKMNFENINTAFEKNFKENGGIVK